LKSRVVEKKDVVHEKAFAEFARAFSFFDDGKLQIKEREKLYTEFAEDTENAEKFKS